jgi:hypothetical protein
MRASATLALLGLTTFNPDAEAKTPEPNCELITELAAHIDTVRTGSTNAPGTIDSRLKDGTETSVYIPSSFRGPNGSTTVTVDTATGIWNSVESQLWVDGGSYSRWTAHRNINSFQITHNSGDAGFKNDSELRAGKGFCEDELAELQTAVTAMKSDLEGKPNTRFESPTVIAGCKIFDTVRRDLETLTAISHTLVMYYTDGPTYSDAEFGDIGVEVSTGSFDDGPDNYFHVTVNYPRGRYLDIRSDNVTNGELWVNHPLLHSDGSYTWPEANYKGGPGACGRREKKAMAAITDLTQRIQERHYCITSRSTICPDIQAGNLR